MRLPFFILLPINFILVPFCDNHHEVFAFTKFSSSPSFIQSSLRRTMQTKEQQKRRQQQRFRTVFPLYEQNSNEVSESDDDENNDDNEQRRKRRMEQVRSIQNSFYSSPDTSGDVVEISISSTSSNTNNDNDDSTNQTPTKLNQIDKQDIISNLPLYRRVGQTELPGRSTIVYVADPRHTHMFESVIRSGPKPWYVGQLYLKDGGFDDLGEFSTVGWRDKLQRVLSSNNINNDNMVDEVTGGSFSSSDVSDSVVIGTLLSVVDYCRIDDGRMMLLVHGVERFVVEESTQERPFPMANVRCIPDIEDLDEALVGSSADTHECHHSRPRARYQAWKEALLESNSGISFFGNNHDNNDQENNNDDKPPNRDIALTDLLDGTLGDNTESLMPLAPFQFVSPKQLLDDSWVEEEVEEQDDSSVSVEMKLIHYGILQDFPSYTAAEESDTLPSSDALEQSLWIVIDKYIRLRNLDYNVIPSELLKLLPPSNDMECPWPEDFGIYQYAMDNNMLSKTQWNTRQNQHDAHRRQRRLSYAATVLLGGTARSTGLLNRGMRQKLLEVPSTKGRLWANLECFEEFLQMM